jgi:LysR family transcriptional activator of nhaA
VEWLNYHHLYYFWTVAREGSVAQASRVLRLAQPTITGQIRALEAALGEKLFARAGRGLVLTETGRVVQRYATEIFTLGRELTGVLRGRPAAGPARLLVGVSDLVPKLIAFRILEPALAMRGSLQIVCYEDRPEALLGDLSTFGLDLVLTDAPVHPSLRVRAFSHLLGTCGVAFFAVPALAARYRRKFPQSLDGAPFLMPLENSVLRRSLEQWFHSIGVHPRVVGEFQDSALLQTFGQSGAGVFAAPAAIEKEIRRRVGLSVIGRTDAVTERYYAISVDRKLKHPAVVAICETARAKLFREPSER